MKITVETVKAKLARVWDCWNNPADIKKWNTAQDDWHTNTLLLRTSPLPTLSGQRASVKHMDEETVIVQSCS